MASPRSASRSGALPHVASRSNAPHPRTASRYAGRRIGIPNTGKMFIILMGP